MLKQIDQPLLVDHFHSQLASLVQLRSRLFAGDYDGGHKGLVRWEDGTQDIVPGSRVLRT